MMHVARNAERVGDRLANSAVLLWATTVYLRLIQIATVIVLARLLTPSDYGVVSIAVVIAGFLDLVSNIQVGNAIICTTDLDQAHLDTAFTLNLIRGVAMAIVIALIAKPAALFMHDSRLEDVLYVMTIPALIGGVHNPHFILYARDINFIRDSLRQAIGFTAGALVGIGAACLCHSYWALLANGITAQFVYAIFSYWRVPGRHRLSLAKSREMLSFGSWFVIVNILDYANSRAEYVLIGNRLGPAMLGAYNIGSTLTTQATWDLITSLSKALFPALSIIADDKARLRAGYRQIQCVTLALGLPIGIGMSALAPDVVLTLAGHKWHMAIPVIQLIAPFVALGTMVASVEALAYALNKGGLLALRSFICMVFSIACMLAGYWLGGFSGILYARVISRTLTLIYTLYFVEKISGAPALEPVVASWRSFIAAGVMWLALTHLPFPALGLVMLLIGKISLGAVLYTSVHGLLWITAGRPDGAETKLLAQWRRLTAKFYPVVVRGS